MFTAQEVFCKIKAKSFPIYSKYSTFSLFSIKRSVSFSCVHEIFILDWNIEYLSIVAEDTVLVLSYLSSILSTQNKYKSCRYNELGVCWLNNTNLLYLTLHCIQLLTLSITLGQMNIGLTYLPAMPVVTAHLFSIDYITNCPMAVFFLMHTYIYQEQLCLQVFDNRWITNLPQPQVLGLLWNSVHSLF